MVMTMPRAPESQPTMQPAAEVDGSAVVPKYVDMYTFTPEPGHDYHCDPLTAEVIDVTTDEVLGFDPYVAADAGLNIQVRALSDEQLTGLLQNELTRPRPYDAPDTVLGDQLLAEIKAREQRREDAATGRIHDTAEMPALVTDAGKDMPRVKRSLTDRISARVDRIGQPAQSRAQTTAKQPPKQPTERAAVKQNAKDGAKELKAFEKQYKHVPNLSERDRLEAKARSYKDWKTAQHAERRSVTKIVKGIVSHVKGNPDQKAARQTSKEARNSARDTMATAHHRLVYINSRLSDKTLQLDPQERANLEAERTERNAVYEEAHQRLEANRRRTLGNKARKAAAADHDAEFNEQEFPSEEAKVLFKNLHDKRINALKLGLESGYKLRLGKKAYRRAYKEYKKAYLACEEATLKLKIEAEGPMSEEQENALVTQLVIDETHAMEKWQFQLDTEAKSTRRGRAAIWLHSQSRVTKLALGVTVGLATGGLAGLAGGAVAGAGLAVAKVARSEGTRRATGLATQNVHKISEADRDRYKGAESSGKAFDMIYADQARTVKKAVRNKRVGLAIAGIGIVGGAIAGNWLNDQLNNQNKTAEAGASRPNAGAGNNGTNPGGAGTGTETAPAVAGSGRVSVDNLIPRGGSAGAARIDGGLASELASGNGATTVVAGAEQAVSHIDTSAGGHPWNYLGNDVHQFAANAAAAGEDVKWHGEGINAWVEVNGRSDNDYVVNTLNKYR